MADKNNTKTEKKSKDFSAMYGLLMLFVVASIAFSTYVVYAGTIGIVPKVMLVPQALFAALVAIRQFIKK